MAKSEEPKEQQTIDGAVDTVSRRVCDNARAYAKTMNHRMKLQEDEAVMKPALDKMMDEDDVSELEVSFITAEDASVRYRVRRGTTEVTKITCKKLADPSE